MSKLQPVNNQRQLLVSIWTQIIAPHSSIRTVGEFRRAQLLSILTLVLGVLLITALLFRPGNTSVFLALGGITLVSYILSRTKYYRLGTYIFSYAFTSLAYISIYQGTAGSIEESIATTVHVSLIISSVLLSQRGFLSLAILATIATFTAPLYSNSPVMEGENIGSTGGIVLVIGAILYGVQVYRAKLEKEGLKEIADANRELEDITKNLEQRIGARTLELELVNQQVQERAARFQIIAEISQEISTAEKITLGGTEELLLNKTETTTNLVVQDGQTIVIGGLIREDTTKAREGIPLLYKIPFLGWLFGEWNGGQSRQEIIILLTPRVIKNQKDAREASGEYIENMSEASEKRIKKEEIIKEKPLRTKENVTPPEASKGIDQQTPR